MMTSSVSLTPVESNREYQQTIGQYVYIVCSLNIVFFSKILKYIPDSGPSRFVCTGHGTPALQQNWQSSEKSQHFMETLQYLMNTQLTYQEKRRELAGSLSS